MSGVLFIDNFDSFTFNLVDAFRALGAEVSVWRNTIPAAEALARAEALPAPRLIVLSPGPGGPADAGCCVELVRLAAGRVPVLGVCLGHQAIVQALGGEVGAAPAIVHGKASRVHHDDEGFLAGLPEPLVVGRYHSLTATRIPDELVIRARTEDGVVMAVEDPLQKLAGVQFHPESILTPDGGELLANALTWAGEERRGGS